MNVVAETHADLTESWLSSALARPVTSVRCEPIGAGRTGASYRLTLSYEHATGPATLIAKVAAVDAAARHAVRKGYATEVGFYRELADALPVRTPECWYCDISTDQTTFTLLLEDLAPSTPGVQVRGCSVEQAAAALRNLAWLHGARWNDDTLLALPFLDRPTPDAAEFVGMLLSDATDGFVERYADALSPQDGETLRAAARGIASWMTSRPEPFTLVHGDYRLDNLMFAPGGDDVAALDWQTLTVGHPSRDVAYFLGTSLDPELRRAHEAALVRAYHDALVAEGVAGYDAERCWNDYRWGHLQGPMITVLGCMLSPSGQEKTADEMFVAMATRSCAAIRDLGSLDLL